MSQLNDAIVAIVGPAIDDGLLAHYKANGATADDLQDAEFEFLVAAGATPGEIQDMWEEALIAASYSGALQDMLLEFWLAGGTFSPPPIPNWDTDPPAVPDGTDGVFYAYNLSADLNTVAQVTITVESGTLPSGLNISGTSIVGTPDTVETQAGISLRATNPSGFDVSLTFDIEIQAVPSSLSIRLDNPTQGSKQVLDEGTELVSGSGPAANWPPYGDHCQSSANVAGIDTTLSDPFFSPMQRKKDLVYLQGRYPSVSRVQTTYDGVVAMKADNLNLKVVEYIYINRTDNNGTSDILGLMWETVAENNAESVWRGVDANSSSLIYDNQGRIFLNHNYEGTDPGDNFNNFALAVCAKYQQKSGTGHPSVNLRQLLDGTFHDSMDYKDAFPTQRNIDNTADTNIDYLKPKSSGNTDPVLYREGLKYFNAQWRLEFGDDQAMSSNGGRDEDSVDEATADNEWAGEWDHRLFENIHEKLGLVKKSGVNELETDFSNMDPRLEKAIRGPLIAAEMVNRTGTNRLGAGLVSLDFVFGWSGPNPTQISDYPQDYFEAARFICGLAVMERKFMAGPCLTRGTLPFPYMDEFVHDCGAPIGGIPTIGSVDILDPALPLTVRAPDVAPQSGSTYGIYHQEFENGLWVLNLNEPVGNADWPQAATDPYDAWPDPGAGFEWRHFDSTYVNPNRVTGGTAAENQSPLVNDGSLAPAILNIPRWHARYFVRTPT